MRIPEREGERTVVCKSLGTGFAEYALLAIHVHKGTAIWLAEEHTVTVSSIRNYPWQRVERHQAQRGILFFKSRQR
jgi:hypothetical protein